MQNYDPNVLLAWVAGRAGELQLLHYAQRKSNSLIPAGTALSVNWSELSWSDFAIKGGCHIQWVRMTF
jgi:hypothetical protein